MRKYRPCMNCFRRFVDHVDSWCLFSPTRYREVDVATYTREYERMLNGLLPSPAHPFDGEDFTRDYFAGEWNAGYRWDKD